MVKDPLKTKGARLSMQLSIAGRYLVYMPNGGGVGASRRLPDAERERQRKLLQKIHTGEGGVIVRTAAQGARKADFERDIDYLRKLHEVMERRAEEVKAPDLVFQEADLSIRVLRDVLTKEFDGAMIDDPKQHHRVTSFFQRTAPELVDVRRALRGRASRCSSRGRRGGVRPVLSRRVDLPSGGYLMIDYAEALTVIDVNTGSFTGRGKGRLEDTITKVNVEAAEEVVRQLRLRDIGGIIVIDFIDMARARNRDQVLKTLRKALDADKTKSYVMEVSPLGPGRDDAPERHRRGARDPHPAVPDLRRRGSGGVGGDGGDRGRPPAPRHARRQREAARRRSWSGSIREVAAELLREGSPLHELEEEDRQALPLRGRRGAGDRHLRDRRPGHPRRDRGAGAPVPGRRGGAGDGSRSRTCTTPTTRSPGWTRYIVSVTGGGRYVGERRLVRIESVARRRRPRRWSASRRAPTATGSR